MSLSHFKLRKLFFQFWKEKNHQEVPPISLIPKDDPTTLFTGSGMQQLIPYLMGEPHPLGKRLFNIQPCFRSQDIEEIGDNRHTTFFEMIGNWSLGDYFKEDQLKWCFEFFTKVLGFPKEKLFVSVFKGTKEVPFDEQSLMIWKKLGVPEERIFYYGPEKNWWSRAGTPDEMPPGEIGGPDSEVFYDFGEEYQLHEKSPYKNEKCHPNCNCGRFLEIGNSVFIQYKKEENGKLTLLPQKNVDFGGGLERILAALANQPDIFKTELYQPIIQKIEQLTGKSYQEKENQSLFRIVADHLKAASFLIEDGILPGNKEQNYLLRRLLRRAGVKFYKLVGIDGLTLLSEIPLAIGKIYKEIYFHPDSFRNISLVIKEEMDKFKKILKEGIKTIEKKKKDIDGKVLFDLYQSYGLPFEIASELLEERGIKVDRKQFDRELEKHRQLSQKASLGVFKGGLADESQQTIKYHTATHLLHQALRDVFGSEVRQEGSNITKERLRFDFRLSRKPTNEEIKKVEEIVNKKIKEKLAVYFKIMPKSKAEKIGALSFFKEKYGDQVKVYFIGGSPSSYQSAYSKEFCGGPHVKNTAEIGSFKIVKVEKIGMNVVRIYGKTPISK